MQTTVRTTIRLRKDLFDQSRLVAFEQGSSLQDVINHALELGFSRITDLNSPKEAMKKIDSFRESLSGKKINIEELLEQNKKDQK
jgi:hypothetical protein